ncbi:MULTISPECIES: GNAT family N-acetyltransferase [unclassified Azospirillum]|uniref:GNAT family N-acetyltransferase n=1 Tax=unclassified Azospirillum TaxID=2630922 RepID=UPI000B6ECFF8|nr:MULTISPECIES: GNAT family N-acetyltransferase [unclassified Azospirillum]SNR91574.1 Acetyltransferase (GNAT) family protein [Azospirillum sp. RU38E]SNS07467.1 Acetyltransferase (GNAT) family protein [Azospirillum sp. RU37A]
MTGLSGVRFTRWPAPDMAGALADFAALTYPRYRPVLLENPIGPQPAGTPIAGNCFAVTAHAGDMPAGLALVEGMWEGEARLLSIMVAPSLRRRGIALALLAAVEGMAMDAGFTRLCCFHNNRMRDVRAFEGLLQRAGWSAPVLAEIRLTGPAGFTDAVRPHWQNLFDRQDRDGYSHSLWADRSQADRDELAALHEGGQVEERLSLQDWMLSHADPHVSLLLRRHGRVVGWIIGERNRQWDCIHYTSGFTIGPLRRCGWMIRGLYEATALQARHYGPDHPARFETFNGNDGMMRLMAERLAPYASEQDRRYRSERVLG